MNRLSVDGEQLLDSLYRPDVRWGWEYVEPAPATRSSEADSPPMWQEPPQPVLPAARNSPLLRGCGVLALISAVGFLLIGLTGVAVGSSSASRPAILAGSIFWVLVFGAVAYFVKFRPQQIAKRIVEQYQWHRSQQLAYFQQVYAAWEGRVAQHDQAEQFRSDGANLFYPLPLRSAPSRVDVFGGLPAGWASLLTTWGTGALAAGRSVLVVDFTEEQVAAGLFAAAVRRGTPASSIELPMGSNRFNLLGGLGPEELAELLAEAVSSMRPATNGGDLRALDAELLGIVVRNVSEPYTIPRLAASIKVLRRAYDVDVDGPLSAQEVLALTRVADSAGQTEQARSELLFLSGLLDMLARNEAPHGAAGRPEAENLFAGRALTVVETIKAKDRHKDLLDRLVFHRVLHDLRNIGRGRGTGVVVVAGADKVGYDALRAMAKQAERSGVQLVVLMERLDEETQRLLGSSDSAAILMRMGNNRDAAAAAEFIGHEHKFVLSQLTEQVGRSFTAGNQLSDGITEGITDSEGTSTSQTSEYMFGAPMSHTRGSDSSKSSSWSRSWQNTVSESISDSFTGGRTTSRVRELLVEPVVIQSLPTTAFILVEAAPSGRRVVLGDCNPGIALLDRVSSTPRMEAAG